MKIAILLLCVAVSLLEQAGEGKAISRRRREGESESITTEQFDFVQYVLPAGYAFKYMEGEEALYALSDGKEVLVSKEGEVRDNVSPDNGIRYTLDDNNNLIDELQAYAKDNLPAGSTFKNMVAEGAVWLLTDGREVLVSKEGELRDNVSPDNGVRYMLDDNDNLIDEFETYMKNDLPPYITFKYMDGAEALVELPDGKEVLVNRWDEIRDNVNPDNGKRYEIDDEYNLIELAALSTISP